MLETFVKLKLSRWFLDVRNTGKAKALVVVPRC